MGHDRRGEIKQVRGWGERVSSTKLGEPLQKKGVFICMYWVVGNEVWRTGEQGLGHIAKLNCSE